MTRTITIKAGMAALALLLGGCASDSGYVPAGQSRVSNLGDAGLKISGRFGHDGGISAPDTNLRKMPGQEIYFENIAGRKLENGFFEVSVIAANRNTYTTLNIQYSIHWYDADGFEISPSAVAWSTLTLQPRETGSIRGVSPSRAATTVTIFVREITYTK
ncbi:MAG: YcfL family protein [Opitutales bacterium]|jgi:uncharacterized protein YcfL